MTEVLDLLRSVLIRNGLVTAFAFGPDNSYAYAASDPIHRTDPEGEDPEDWPGIAQILALLKKILNALDCRKQLVDCMDNCAACLQDNGLSNQTPIGDTEQWARNRFPTMSPQWTECYSQQQACRDQFKACGQLGHSP